MFDANAVASERLVLARALSEITPEKLSPFKFRVGITEGHDANVDVQYSWKPNICSSCQSVGHTVEASVIKLPRSFSSKLLLPPPLVRKWVLMPRTSICDVAIAANPVVVPPTFGIVPKVIFVPCVSTVSMIAPPVKQSIYWQS